MIWRLTRETRVYNADDDLVVMRMMNHLALQMGQLDEALYDISVGRCRLTLL